MIDNIEQTTVISQKSLGENFQKWKYHTPITLHWENLNAYSNEPNRVLNYFRKEKKSSQHIIKYGKYGKH